MVANVAPLFRCRCGLPGRRRKLVFLEEEVGQLVVCDECLAEDDAMLERVRPIFDAMIAAGIERVIANETMSFMLERM